MRVIYKYKLEYGIVHLHLDPNAEILTVAAQGNALVLWAKVDSKSEVLMLRTFAIYATGEAIPHEPQTTKYIGTVFQGDFVWHVFELLIR